MLFFDTMWADPQTTEGFGSSAARGAGCVTFGPDVTRRFCEINRLRMIVRSHEVPKTMTGVQARSPLPLPSLRPPVALPSPSSVPSGRVPHNLAIISPQPRHHLATISPQPRHNLRTISPTRCSTTAG